MITRYERWSKGHFFNMYFYRFIAILSDQREKTSMPNEIVCPNCSTVSAGDSKFCGNCGYSFAGTPPPTPPIPADPPVSLTQQPAQVIIQEVKQTKYITRVVIYRNEKQMQKGIDSWQKGGWEVASTEVVEQGWGCSKTCCLGSLFLPLALLGKKGNHFKVVFRKPE